MISSKPVAGIWATRDEWLSLYGILKFALFTTEFKVSTETWSLPPLRECKRSSQALTEHAAPTASAPQRESKPRGDGGVDKVRGAWGGWSSGGIGTSFASFCFSLEIHSTFGQGCFHGGSAWWRSWPQQGHWPHS